MVSASSWAPISKELYPTRTVWPRDSSWPPLIRAHREFSPMRPPQCSEVTLLDCRPSCRPHPTVETSRLFSLVGSIVHCSPEPPKCPLIEFESLARVGSPSRSSTCNHLSSPPSNRVCAASRVARRSLPTSSTSPRAPESLLLSHRNEFSHPTCRPWISPRLRASSAAEQDSTVPSDSRVSAKYRAHSMRRWESHE